LTKCRDAFQNNAEIWAQSEATEINSLIQFGAFSPVYNGPAQSKLNESSRHINTRFHALRSKANCETDFLTKPSQSQRHYTNNFVATFWQTRTIATKACMKSKRPSDLSGSRSNISGRKNLISTKSKAISAKKREIKPMSNTLWGKGVLEHNIPSQVVVHL
jgi:hypothetical protein